MFIEYGMHIDTLPEDDITVEKVRPLPLGLLFIRIVIVVSIVLHKLTFKRFYLVNFEYFKNGEWCEFNICSVQSDQLRIRCR